MIVVYILSGILWILAIASLIKIEIRLKSLINKINSL